jgi:hypothetical protein
MSARPNQQYPPGISASQLVRCREVAKMEALACRARDGAVFTKSKDEQVLLLGSVNIISMSPESCKSARLVREVANIAQV